MSITIYHNPDCGTSRNTLALIRNSGAEPTIIYYLETPPSGDELRQLLTFMESPVVKKYYAANPQMASLLAEKLVEATRSEVDAHIKDFDTRAAHILGRK